MLNRIFKTILVLSICVGISLPTNAAVSVSDGSAFVTKAEFAADLNNLSNRMAQLENSLDAKIDSLVSSYLTRNGIWNGAGQTMDTSYYLFSPWKNAATGTTYKWTNGQNGYTGPTINNVTMHKLNFKTPSSFASGTYYKQVWENNKVVCSALNKTGLLTIVIQTGYNNQWRGVTGTGSRTFYIELANEEFTRLLALTGVHFDFKVGNSNNYQSKLDISVLNGIVDTDSLRKIAPYGVNLVDSTYFFFVEKGQELVFDVYWDYYGYVDGAKYAFNKDWGTYADNNQGVGMVIKSLSIY